MQTMESKIAVAVFLLGIILNFGIADAVGDNNVANSVFGVTGSQERMQATDSNYTSDDGTVTLVRYQYYINNFPLWNSGGVLSRTSGTGTANVTAAANKVDKNAAATYSQGLAKKLQRGLPLDNRAKEACKNLISANDPRNISSSRFIYYNGSQDLTAENPDNMLLVSEVVVAGEYPNGTMYIRHCIVDLHSNTIVKHWDGFPAASEGLLINGGNVRIGKYQYGENRPDLPITETDDGKCKYETADGVVRALNSHFKKSMVGADNEFSCDDEVSDEANGAYGVMADLFYNAVKVNEMFTNKDWGGLDKVVSTGKLKLYGHYGQRYENANYHSVDKVFYFGDGSSMTYPLGTCLDVVAHEMAHAVTAQFSKLVYTGESGCLNEGFSDAMGQMAVAYVNGTNNFKVAYGCMKDADAMRNMATPVNYHNFFPNCAGDEDDDCQDPHSCSAIVNYIFYKLATSPGWSTQLAGKAFIAANKLYWGREETISQAGCDVASAVANAGIANGDTAAVVKAWAAASIDISSCVVKIAKATNLDKPKANASTKRLSTPTRTTTASISTTTTQEPVSTTITEEPDSTTTSRGGRTPNSQSSQQPSNNAIKIPNCDQTQKNLSVSQDNQLLFVVAIPRNATSGWLQVEVVRGRAPDLYFQYEKPPTTSAFEQSSLAPSTTQRILAPVKKPGSDAYVLITAKATFRNSVNMYVCFW